MKMIDDMKIHNASLFKSIKIRLAFSLKDMQGQFYSYNVKPS